MMTGPKAAPNRPQAFSTMAMMSLAHSVPEAAMPKATTDTVESAEELKPAEEKPKAPEKKTRTRKTTKEKKE